MDHASFEGRRKHPRHSLRNTITVLDKNTGEVLGSIANLSEEGILLVNNEPLESDNIYQIRLKIAAGILQDNQSAEIDLGIDCLWISPAKSAASTYWSGCQIIDASDEAFALIKQIIDKLAE